MSEQQKLPGHKETIAFTGHRPNKIESADLVKNTIKKYLAKSPKDPLVISGGAQGVDQIAAEACVELGIKFVIALPFPFEITTRHWSTNQKKKLKGLMEKAFDVVVVSESYYKSGYQKRNEYMVDNCDTLVSYYNGSKGGTLNTINYAKNKKVTIYNLYRGT